jgi:hypothetical protein
MLSGLCSISVSVHATPLSDFASFSPIFFLACKIFLQIVACIKILRIDAVYKAPFASLRGLEGLREAENDLVRRLHAVLPFNSHGNSTPITWLHSTWNPCNSELLSSNSMCFDKDFPRFFALRVYHFTVKFSTFSDDVNKLYFKNLIGTVDHRVINHQLRLCNFGFEPCNFLSWTGLNPDLSSLVHAPPFLLWPLTTPRHSSSFVLSSDEKPFHMSTCLLDTMCGSTHFDLSCPLLKIAPLQSLSLIIHNRE